MVGYGDTGKKSMARSHTQHTHTSHNTTQHNTQHNMLQTQATQATQASATFLPKYSDSVPAPAPAPAPVAVLLPPLSLVRGRRRRGAAVVLWSLSTSARDRLGTGNPPHGPGDLGAFATPGTRKKQRTTSTAHARHVATPPACTGRALTLNHLGRAHCPDTSRVC